MRDAQMEQRSHPTHTQRMEDEKYFVLNLWIVGLEVEERRAETEGCLNQNDFNFIVSARCYDNATVGDLFYDCGDCLL